MSLASRTLPPPISQLTSQPSSLLTSQPLRRIRRRAARIMPTRISRSSPLRTFSPVWRPLRATLKHWNHVSRAPRPHIPPRIPPTARQRLTNLTIPWKHCAGASMSWTVHQGRRHMHRQTPTHRLRQQASLSPSPPHCIMLLYPNPYRRNRPWPLQFLPKRRRTMPRQPTRCQMARSISWPRALMSSSRVLPALLAMCANWRSSMRAPCRCSIFCPAYKARSPRSKSYWQAQLLPRQQPQKVQRLPS